MGWIDYYNLLEEYGGEWGKVPHEMKVVAANRNPNDPVSALELAKRKYKESHPNKNYE